MTLAMLELSLIVLRCADLERSRHFYAALGCALVREQHGAGPVHYSCRLGPTLLELYPALDKSTRDLRLGLTLDKLDAVLERIVELGGELRRSRPRYAVVLDPDGHTLELRPPSGETRA